MHENNEYIGNFIRSYRLARKESMQSLAKRSGVSSSMIGQIESAQTSPTLSVLAKLAVAMEIRLGDLVEPPEESFGLISVSASEDNRLSPDESPFVYHLLHSKTAHTNSEIYRFYFRFAGKTSFSANVRGSIKSLWLESGHLTLSVANSDMNIKPESLVTFKASIPHRFESRGECLAKGLMIVNY